ncbi:hypothetical protein MMC21_005248 [Puttea exsequens]|nr:hypothetical protein [Puttea exsequens]
MPDRPLTVLTYAASASLAAVALVYFFNPNYLIDGDSSASSASTRKKGVIGLFNPANDCFINSVLQSLAGLGDLRLYLIRETHRRELAGPEVYAAVPLIDKNGKEVDGRKLASLQGGEVTLGLKVIIDSLNERPIYKKTISATSFIRVLEHAFGTHISKSQQDAQELLQIVAERLSEEYHAGEEARKRARLDQNKTSVGTKDIEAHSSSRHKDGAGDEKSSPSRERQTSNAPTILTSTENDEETSLQEIEEGLPLEGQTEARVECQYCHFMPKASPTSFVMLNLTVPQKSSTSLNDCFDNHFKTEYIEDYKCDKCRLVHAVEVYNKELKRATSKEQQERLRKDVVKLEEALENDPEKAPQGVELPETILAPKRKIARHIEITTFPKILVIHLSRSVFDPRSSMTKNLARLAFPERFPVGGILNRRNYKLLGVVTHKGTHNNGHYETFRRQHLYAPFSTPHVDRTSGPYSFTAAPSQSHQKLAPHPAASTEKGSLAPSPTITVATSKSKHSPSHSQSSGSSSLPSTRPSSGAVSTPIIDPRTSDSSASPSLPPPAIDKPNSNANDASGGKANTPNSSRNASIDLGIFKRKKKPVDRWWRISDDKIKECKTAEVLAMQKEVYMLFYEIEKGDSERG